MVSAILTGVFDLAPTKLYKVGTMQDIPAQSETLGDCVKILIFAS